MRVEIVLNNKNEPLGSMVAFTKLIFLKSKGFIYLKSYSYFANSKSLYTSFETICVHEAKALGKFAKLIESDMANDRIKRMEAKY